MISAASAVEVVDQLPDWAFAKDGIIYYVTSEPACYIRNSSVPDKWYNITGDDSKSFETVATLPAWDAADPDILYLVPDENGLLSAYKKDPDHTGRFFELSGNDPIIMEDIKNIFDEVFNN